MELVDERGNRADALTMPGSGASIALQEDDEHRISIRALRSAGDLAWFLCEVRLGRVTPPPADLPAWLRTALRG